jgi:hypothetical protein
MKKHQFALLGFGLVLATVSACAQSNNLKADVPFNFVVAGKTLIGGEYTIRSEKAAPQHELSINRMARSSVVFLAVPCLSSKGSKPSNQTKLVFDRYGDQYFLSEIWVKGSRVAQKLLRSHREVEIAQNNRLQQTIVIAELR